MQNYGFDSYYRYADYVRIMNQNFARASIFNLNLTY